MCIYIINCYVFLVNCSWRISCIDEPGGLQSVGLHRVGHNWVIEHSTNILCFLAAILPFPGASVCHFSFLVLHTVFLSFLFFVSYLCSRFTSYGYHEVYIKCLTDKIVLFLLISLYLHLSIQVPSFSSSSFMFLLSQNVPFQVENLLPNWGSYSYFYCLFSPFPLHTITKCLKICCDKELQFSDSVCKYITSLKFCVLLPFLSQVEGHF